ncbi:Acetyltransferase, gnat family [Sulfitobacter noctilucicola]|uniref:GNAT superfamily N-acetyltransferase n=1 Tax=Sulfitobacter noctilucicola TaxID=1342301 RepID=A0A7W6M783_9RHOB|nr:GNAT family N-acetyltransferase [Sulfitobacter noctilucicola]KIN62503.1 Acetyltransferase, gnat family [Sulfitobacter noctilucicola]MBB4172967.1 GNAT superfamily N-acetyltransferase [Sulfitobacter noctilucicola]
MTPSVTRLYEVCEHTWPAAREWTSGAFTLRDGQGGGKRVSAATAIKDASEQDIAGAEQAMKAIGQTPLFMIREGEEALDALLEARGYQVIDPVILYTLPIEKLTDVPIPRVTAFNLWEPLAIMREIWAAGGVGPARIAVMERAKVKTAILSRWNEKPGGVAFAAVHDHVCMVHAVEVLPHQRRQGVAQWMMRRAAFWGKSQGATHLSVLCVEQNEGANALYRALGFCEVGRYHYRIRPE